MPFILKTCPCRRIYLNIAARLSWRTKSRRRRCTAGGKDLAVREIKSIDLKNIEHAESVLFGDMETLAAK
jgi:hypothetical protein